MKNLLSISFRIFTLNSLVLAALGTISVRGQDTITVPTSKGRTVEIRESALPVLDYEANQSKRRSFSNEEKVSILNEKPSGKIFKDQDAHFCSTPNGRPLPKGVKAVGGLDCGVLQNKPCFWNKPIILVGFINGTPEIKGIVREVIAEWTTWANVAFIVDENNNFEGDSADIKILFADDGPHNSALGINAWESFSRKGKNYPTMNLGYLTPPFRNAAGEIFSDVRGTVLHEFGHALGMHHEHQNPIGGIQWNRDAVIADLSGPPNSWNTETIDFNIFRALKEHMILATTYDSSSIMHYFVPASWTLNNVAVNGNNNLSVMDKKFVSQRYPRKKSVINGNQYYRLTTWYKSGTNCLGVGYRDYDSGRSYFPFFVPCDKNSNAQLWKLTPVGDGDYRVTNYWMGDEVSIDDVGAEYFAELRKTGNYSGQLWTITDLGKFKRMSSKNSGGFYSFTTDTQPNTRLEMRKTAHWSNQLWDFVPAQITR